MIKKLFIGFLPLLLLSFSFGQNYISSIKKGKILELNVIPIGDAYTDPDDEYTIKLMLKDTSYCIELWKKELVQKNELNEIRTLEVINFFENWKTDRCKWAECGLTFSFVSITIGNRKKKFRAGFYYGNEIINNYF